MASSQSSKFGVRGVSPESDGLAADAAMKRIVRRLFTLVDPLFPKMQKQLQEIIVATAGPSTTNQGAGTITLYDIHTGSSLFTLKQSLAGPKCTVATQTRDGQGGLVLAAQTDKSLLNVYSYQKVSLSSALIHIIAFKTSFRNNCIFA
jgi:hypothetical protein